jgi:hypothetical protein
MIARRAGRVRLGPLGDRDSRTRRATITSRARAATRSDGAKDRPRSARGQADQAPAEDE